MNRKPLPRQHANGMIVNPAFMDLYRHWMKTGAMMSGYGLCRTEIDDEPKLKKILALLVPRKQELKKLELQGYDTSYWARGIKPADFVGQLGRSPVTWAQWHHKEADKQFTPLRQNIVLLCAALNGELDA